MTTKSKPAPSCGACAHCVPIATDMKGDPVTPVEGTCRRLPPIPMMKIDGNVVSAFPQVRLADIWCGEFHKRGK